MVDIRRLRGPLLVLICLAVVSVVCGQFLFVMIGVSPRWLPSHDGKKNPEAYRLFGSRLAGAVRMERGAPRRSTAAIAAILGASTVECGIDPKLMSADDGSRPRWLSLYGYRLDGEELDAVARLLFRSELRPKFVVVAINAGMLSRRSTVEAFERKPEWPFPYRVRVNHLVWHAVLEARLALANRFGVGVDSLFDADPNPWGVPARIGYLEVQDDPRRRLKRHWAGLKQKGWLDPSCFTPDGPNGKALVDLVGRARDGGAQVLIVLLPDMKALREAMPAEAARLPATLMRQAFGASAPAVIDLRDSLEDEAFFDLIHVLPSRRDVFSRKLSQALRPFLEGPEAGRRIAQGRGAISW